MMNKTPFSLSLPPSLFLSEEHSIHKDPINLVRKLYSISMAILCLSLTFQEIMNIFDTFLQMKEISTE